jgi:hypothetical protein
VQVLDGLHAGADAAFGLVGLHACFGTRTKVSETKGADGTLHQHQHTMKGAAVDLKLLFVFKVNLDTGGLLTTFLLLCLAELGWLSAGMLRASSLRKTLCACGSICLVSFDLNGFD